MSYLNSLHVNLKFTQEKETDGKLNFLDVTVIKTANNIETDWHIKSTNTGVYLPKCAFSPSTHKKAAIRSLIYRAHQICNTPERFENSYLKIKAIFFNNGYHPQI